MRRIKDPWLKELAKDESILVGRVQRFVEANQGDEGRREDCIHPSELCHDDFCPRAAFYRIAGYPEINPEPAHNFWLRQIFQEGSDIHSKWQRHLWDMGLLSGRFGCLSCRQAYETKAWDGERTGPNWRWWDEAPQECPSCGAPRYLLVYLEVPLEDEEHLIYGHADGEVGDDLIEIKSIGKGTIRVEAPDLYDRYTKKAIIDGEERSWLDLDGLWRSIKRPFVTHLRQGQIYLHCRRKERVIFIYECKWNQQYKEFVVRYQPDLLEEMFDMALDVKWGLKTNRVPVCPHGGCSKCRVYEGEASATSRGRITNPGRGNAQSQGRDGEAGLPNPSASRGRDPETPEADNRSQRRRVDGTDDRAGQVDGPYLRRIGTPRGRRTVRRFGV